MNTLDSYHESRVNKMVFKTDLIYVLLDNSYVASSLVRQHYSPGGPAWQSEHDKLDEYRELLRRAQSILEQVEERLAQKILNDKVADETPF